MERKLINITGHSERSEKALEAYLRERARHFGLKALKYYNPDMAGYPDRLVLLPGGRVVWVELKSTGRKPNALQRVRHAELRRLGHAVYVADSRRKIDSIFNPYPDTSEL